MRNLPRRSFLLSSATAIAVLAMGRAMAADPDGVADRVFQIYVDTLDKSNALFEGTPPAAEIAGKFDALKEKAVTALVKLGHEISAMSAGDRARVESGVNASISRVLSKPRTKAIYEAYQKAWSAYSKADPEFFQKVKSLNILTQYAFFDLLRKQEPDEADRLGV